jgi:hypothetical protein
MHQMETKTPENNSAIERGGAHFRERAAAVDNDRPASVLYHPFLPVMRWI